MTDTIFEIVKKYAVPEKICPRDYGDTELMGNISWDERFNRRFYGHIYINPIFSRKEQVYTLLHECMHMHPKLEQTHIEWETITEMLESLCNSIFGIDIEKYVIKDSRVFTWLDKLSEEAAGELDEQDKEILERYDNLKAEAYRAVERQVKSICRHVFKKRQDIVEYLEKILDKAYEYDASLHF